MPQIKPLPSLVIMNELTGLVQAALKLHGIDYNEEVLSDLKTTSPLIKIEATKGAIRATHRMITEWIEREYETQEISGNPPEVSTYPHRESYP